MAKPQEIYLLYDNTWVAHADNDSKPATWTNEAYRTITFEEEPTGDLLTWLQANATQQ